MTPWKDAVALGDLTVLDPPLTTPKMWKALAVISTHLHPAYDALPDTVPGYSKETCMFTSLCVRDFLVAIGFADATGRSVALLIRSDDNATGEEIHSVGIGVRNQLPKEGKFNGHFVVTVPSLNLLIDTTMYQAQRPAWGGALPSMVAMEYDIDQTRERIWDCSPIAGRDVRLSDRTLTMIWLDRPEIRWKRDTDFKRNDRRRAITRALVEAFGEWKEN